MNQDFSELPEITIMAKKLRAAEAKVREALKAKRDFLANIGHEIRTPMNAVIGMTHLALQANLASKPYNYISKARSAANSILDVLNEVLDVSHDKSDTCTVEQVDFSLNEVLEQIVILMALEAPQRGIELSYHIQPDIPGFLVGDPLRLRQILTNLFQMAITSAVTNEICISAEVTNQTDENIQLKFMASEIGMGEKKMCSRGWFVFEATFGHSRQQEGKMVIMPTDLQNLKTLVVDNNVISQRILKTVLMSFSFRVDTVNSGNRALKAICDMSERDPYRLVIMAGDLPGFEGSKAADTIRGLANVSDQLKIILLSTYGQKGIYPHAEKTGVDACLNKPVSALVLSDTINACFGQEPPQAGLSEQEPASEEPVSLGKGHVLLVEDNEINQEIALELLKTDQLSVVVASNGQEAVERVTHERFDLILMDIQMPVMDGYQATREICTYFKANQITTPIIAMTANVGSSDREKCIAAGMLDQIAKPMEPVEFFKTVNRWLAFGKGAIGANGVQMVETEHEKQKDLPEIPLVNTRSGLARVSGNRSLYLSLLKKFSEEYQNTLSVLRTAMDGRDSETAERTAHSLKSVAGNIGIESLENHAKKLEYALRNNDKTAIEELLANVASSLEEAAHSIAAYVKQHVEPPRGPTEPGSEKKLSEFLERLKPYAEKGKPKQIIQIIEEMSQYCWPEPKVDDVVQLEKLLSRYRFKEAVRLINTLLGNTLSS